MTIGVVDLFEAVEVEERDRQRQPAALSTCEISVEQLGEQTTVGQTGEGIAPRREQPCSPADGAAQSHRGSRPAVHRALPLPVSRR